MKILKEVRLTDAQRKFLDIIQDGDVNKNVNDAIKWCIEACMYIEKNYPEMDAVYIAFHDIRKEGDPPFKTTTRKWK